MNKRKKYKLSRNIYLSFYTLMQYMQNIIKTTKILIISDV